MAHCIDDKIVSVKPNKFNEVDRMDAPAQRSGFLDPKTFKPPVRESKLAEPVRKLKLSDIIGTGDATWWSPGYANLFLPHAEQLAMRTLAAEGQDVRCMKTAWLSKLCTSRLLIRRKGTLAWALSLGNLCASLVKTWPVEWKDHRYCPVLGDDTVAGNVVIVDDLLYEAIPIQPVAPLRTAVKMELVGHHGDHIQNKVVTLKHSHCYGRLSVGAVALDTEKSLRETHARLGFPGDTLAFMTKYAKHIGAVCAGKTMFPILTGLLKKIIPDISNELLASIYVLKGVDMEPDDELEALLEYRV